MSGVIVKNLSPKKIAETFSCLGFRRGFSRHPAAEGYHILATRRQHSTWFSHAAHIEIVTPDDGYVVGLTMHTSGGVIVKGEKIMDIIPTGVRLVVEVNIKPEEINEVHVGAQAEVHFIPYKTTTYPKIMGQITTLSADRLTDPRTGQNYYQATVDVSKDDLKAAPDIVPLPGMPVEVFIPTLKRTPLQLLVYPLVSGISHSFRER